MSHNSEAPICQDAYPIRSVSHQRDFPPRLAHPVSPVFKGGHPSRCCQSAPPPSPCLIRFNFLLVEVRQPAVPSLSLPLLWSTPHPKTPPSDPHSPIRELQTQLMCWLHPQLRGAGSHLSGLHPGGPWSREHPPHDRPRPAVPKERQAIWALVMGLRPPRGAPARHPDGQRPGKRKRRGEFEFSQYLRSVQRSWENHHCYPQNVT